jgi:hypothetical protein
MTGNRPEGKGWTERWYRVMLLGYPEQYRARHGGELLGTLMEAHPSRRLPSLRESVSLLDAGVLTRLRTRLDKVPAWADGLQLGLLLLALTQAGSLLGDLFTAHHRPDRAILLPASLLVVVAVLLGRMGIAAVVALIPAALATYQTLQLGIGTAYLVGGFPFRTFELSSNIFAWQGAGGSQFWLITVGSVVLAVRGRTRGPLPRRSWWWLTVPLLEGAFYGYTRTLMPAAHAPAVNASIPQPPAVPPTSVIALSTLPLIAVTIGFLLLALRATVATGDPRWAIATGVYLVPIGVSAAAIVSAEPSGIVTLEDQLPVVLLAVVTALVLLRRGPRRAEN